MKRKLQVIQLGLRDYQETYALQKTLARRRIAGEIQDTIILVEHPSVFTIGRRGGREHLVVSEETLRETGIQVYDVDRGGDITYHGPGQIVGYPILDIRNHGQDILRIFHLYEEVLVRVLREYDVHAQADPEYPGVWADDRKVAAIGIGVHRMVTYHGFALNVDPDLDYFNMIIPCGISDRGVTSLSQLLGRKIDVDEVISRIVNQFASSFGFTAIDIRGEMKDGAVPLPG